MERICILEVAKFFLSKESMTHKKLQKLCWYAYSWALFSFTEKLDEIIKPIDGKFQAWVHGPVDPVLYDEYRENKWNDIEKYFGEININKGLITFLDEVYKEYGKYTGDELEAQTHSELPWKNARKNLKPWESSTFIINDLDIFTEYSQRS